MFLSKQLIAFSMNTQAAKILANILIAGGTLVFRAATTAYRQAIISEFHCAALIL